MKDILDFLEQLQTNNNRKWFQANQVAYKKAKEQFTQLVIDIRDRLVSFDENIDSDLRPHDMIFKINRDIRFSKDRTPYKISLSASITRDGGKKSPYGWYYVSIQPWNHSSIWWWLHYPKTETVKSMRQLIDNNEKERKSVISQKDFRDSFGDLQWRSLTRNPRWYNDSDTFIKDIRRKDRFVMREFSDTEVLSDTFLDTITQHFRNLTPFVGFVNNAIIEKDE